VVAHEIKSLADQSREATEQIRNILEEIRRWVSAVVVATEQGSKAVNSGFEQSNLAGDSIGKLTESVTASAQAATVINASSEQQLSGVDQVAGAMGNIELAVRQNLDGSSQLEASAQKLEALGGKLRALVQQYKV
jgi:methyl-accepting chemotaxis protein